MSRFSDRLNQILREEIGMDAGYDDPAVVRAILDHMRGEVERATGEDKPDVAAFVIDGLDRVVDMVEDEQLQDELRSEIEEFKSMQGEGGEEAAPEMPREPEEISEPELPVPVSAPGEVGESY